MIMFKKQIPIFQTGIRKPVSKTKLVGYLMIGGALINTVVDALNGNGFDCTSHLHNLNMAMNGAGFVFMRNAISKIENKLF